MKNRSIIIILAFAISVLLGCASAAWKVATSTYGNIGVPWSYPPDDDDST